MTNLVFRFATVQGQHVHWLLRRNCSVTPLQLVWTYVSLCVVSLGIGIFFWFQGATLVIPFASLELIAVGLAFLVYARHSTDRERISLQENRLALPSSGLRASRKTGSSWSWNVRVSWSARSFKGAG